MLFIKVITRTPKKLKTAAMSIANLGEMERVEIQVAIALGASVQPFTNITPRVKRTVILNVGLAISWLIKSCNETLI